MGHGTGGFPEVISVGQPLPGRDWENGMLKYFLNYIYCIVLI
jgi:hypothetical protein